MNDHSLPEWIDEKISESDQAVSDNTRLLDALKALQDKYAPESTTAVVAKAGKGKRGDMDDEIPF